MRHLILVLLCLLSAACGAFDDDGIESRRLAQGYTPCNDLPDPEEAVICHPNQYCASPKLGWCHSGCLSDDNCSHEQICAKRASANLGECVDVATLPDPDPELAPGYTTCGDPSHPSQYTICQPSQHCYSHYLGDCGSGCLSEHNCTEQQVCVKAEGENVGVCQARDEA